ncbi:NAD(P)H-hydrate dehydratase [Caproicibacter fermentans]|uniref:Multifunctional fusion protein n=1 Tax=Caproicibacter fermentans TaxID=2576756 RepID=A0A7G8TBC9_9FIRM|nr:NAD(P)H-hydrate dehydratase [Caproicibacter fermentans]QNK40920.1 NAD(P)H-hydrate dehydratase [Caproicibacter fermentans]
MLLIGTDLVEIARIRKSMRNPLFCARILGKSEYEQLARRGFPAQSVAASFCAKEAFSKAVGTGLSGFCLREAELLREPNGKPRLQLTGKAAHLAENMRFSVSVTHTAETAAATVVGWNEKSEMQISEERDVPEGRRILLNMLKPRGPESNKGCYGRLLCVCGSEGMAGAAAMSTLSALRCGTGIVETALPRSIYPIVASLAPEAVFTLLDASPGGDLADRDLESLDSALSRASACLVGCGLGKSPFARRTVSRVLQTADVPLVLDADGINIVSEHIDELKTVRAPLVLTPHPGEMARLLRTTPEEVQKNRELFARSFARDLGVILVLKGFETLVVSPQGKLYRNTTGNPGMAKGGSGDVLAGMIASFAAQGVDLFSAAAGAVYLHGLAGDRCAGTLSQCAMLPTDLIGKLPELFLELGR